MIVIQLLYLIVALVLGTIYPNSPFIDNDEIILEPITINDEKAVDHFPHLTATSLGSTPTSEK